MRAGWEQFMQEPFSHGEPFEGLLKGELNRKPWLHTRGQCSGQRLLTLGHTQGSFHISTVGEQGQRTPTLD